MKRLAVSLLTALALSAHAGELHVAVVAATGNPVQADAGIVNYNSWINNTGGPIYIRQIATWIGVSQGTVADISVQITRLSDGAALYPLGWDHYLDSSAPNLYVRSFAPDYITLQPGDGIGVLAGGGAGSFNALNYGYTGCTNLPGFPHVITLGWASWIYYVTVQPQD